MRSLWRRVFHAHWRALGWSSTYDRAKAERHEPQFTWSFNPSHINIPRLRWFREAGGGFVCLEWGNGNSDPVWSIGVEW